MNPLIAGVDVVDARKKLGITQADLADVLGIGVSSVRRHEASAELNPLIALAVECLLRRRAASFQKALTPEERAERKFREHQRLKELRQAVETPEARAERKFREQQRLAELRRQAGLPARGAQTAEDRAHQQVDYSAERSRLRMAIARNKMRDADREMVRAAHGYFKAAWEQGGRDALAAEIYRIEISPALFSGDDGTARYYLREYVAETRKRFDLGMDPPLLPDNHPLTTLDPESEE